MHAILALVILNMETQLSSLSTCPLTVPFKPKYNSKLHFSACFLCLCKETSHSHVATLASNSIKSILHYNACEHFHQTIPSNNNQHLAMSPPQYLKESLSKWHSHCKKHLKNGSCWILLNHKSELNLCSSIFERLDFHFDQLLIDKAPSTSQSTLP